MVSCFACDSRPCSVQRRAPTAPLYNIHLPARTRSSANMHRFWLGCDAESTLRPPLFRWRGPWYAIFGDCSAPDVMSCLVAWKLPFAAWAWNQNRTMGFNFWKELLRFVGLTVGFFAALHVASCVMMMTLCKEGRQDQMLTGETVHAPFLACTILSMHHALRGLWHQHRQLLPPTYKPKGTPAL